MSKSTPHVMPFRNLGRGDVAIVGGKNASLGELIRNLAATGVNVPDGFATTAAAYREFVAENRLESVIADTLRQWKNAALTLSEAGTRIRAAFAPACWPKPLAESIVDAYRQFNREMGLKDAAVAVRSSATAEDLPEASFAGQQETYLNISGEVALLAACKRCYASLFTDRAIVYRDSHHFDHLKVALSVGVQRMVRSDRASSGVMFSIDTETGFDKVVLINAAWGLGELVVQGEVDPDEYTVFKPLLNDLGLLPIIGKKIGSKALKMIYAREAEKSTKVVSTSLSERVRCVLGDEEILTLSRWACAIEKHYGMPMDMEWAKDGDSGRLYIVQARPETVQSQRKSGMLQSYKVTGLGRKLLTGLAIGEGAVQGAVRIVRNPHAVEAFPQGSILVAENTTPDWVPIMRKAAAIVTDHGGRTSHAAIVSRELGVTALIGTGEATRILHDEQEVTVSCTEGETGSVHDGPAEIHSEQIDISRIPATRTQILFNLANPDAAFRWWRLPADGVGLARMEFVISNVVKIHPMALAHPERVTDRAIQTEIERLTEGYANGADYFVDRLACNLARLAAVLHPKPMILRLSDFKTNEYANLIGGRFFEPKEENPMIGFRGASRYYSPAYQDGFALECRAIHRLREILGFRNVVVMVPFCRTPEEADRVLEVMAAQGLKRGEQGLRIYVMCEVPSNVILAEEFARRFDGFSIGSNDLTQLTLGVDRDSDQLAPLFNENNAAVLTLIRDVIRRAHAVGIPVGLCGEAPSHSPKFAAILVEAGIDSISVNPASFIAVKENVQRAEAGSIRCN